MNSNFPRTLSLLRKEKKLSQKTAAAELKISQALLSHYENGVREPGLSFVVAASDFYGVSADYLLGRTMSRDGTAINVDELYDDASSRDNRLRGSAVSMVSKKLLVNSLGILFDLLGKSGDADLPGEAYAYISSSVYRLFRALYEKSGVQAGGFFALDRDEYAAAAEARRWVAWLKYARALEYKEDDLPAISNDVLTRDYPMLVQSLLSLTHSVEKDTKHVMNALDRE